MDEYGNVLGDTHPRCHLWPWASLASLACWRPDDFFSKVICFFAVEHKLVFLECFGDMFEIG